MDIFRRLAVTLADASNTFIMSVGGNSATKINSNGWPPSPKRSQKSDDESPRI
jgi:hypothetical protein